MTDTPELIERLIEIRDYLSATGVNQPSADDLPLEFNLHSSESTLQAQERTLTRVREWAQTVLRESAEFNHVRLSAREVLGILDGGGER